MTSLLICWLSGVGEDVVLFAFSLLRAAQHTGMQGNKNNSRVHKWSRQGTLLIERHVWP